MAGDVAAAHERTGATSRRGIKDRTARIVRFSLFERITHWLVTLSFLVAALTGMGLYMPGLFWLTSIFGGGTSARWLHPWAGAVFAGSLVVMTATWARQMLFDRLDRLWLRHVSAYVTHGGETVEAGRFNAGQKLLFWMVLTLGVLEAATGFVMWNPARFQGSWALILSYPVHSLVAAGFLALIFLHVYMATIALPGTFETMTHGRIPRYWARFHHPRWYREIEAREAGHAPAPARAPTSVDVAGAPRQSR